MFGTGRGLMLTPIPAVSVSEALASPSSTSTEACPVNSTISVIVGGFTSTLSAITIDAEPDAIPRSMARARPIPACKSRFGLLLFSPRSTRPLPARGETIQLKGLSGLPIPTVNPAPRGDSWIEAPRSKLMPLSSPRPRGRVGRAKLSSTLSLPSERAILRPAALPPGRKDAMAWMRLKIVWMTSSALLN